MNYNIISTGSKGNAVIIDGTILIDCGVTFKALTDVYSKIKIVLLTHIHVDHFNGTTIKILAKKRPTLRFACCKWLVNDLLRCDVNPLNIDVLEIGKKYDYGAFAVSPVKLYHNVANCGYRLYMGAEKLFYATDTNTLDGITAKNYDLYMIEANYEDEEIKQRIAQKEEQGAYIYEYNVLKNHLSKAKCDAFIGENASPNSMFVYMHRHEVRKNA